MKKLGVVYFLLFITIASLSSLQYSVELVDTYGDGWNGGSLTVNVNGISVLSGLTIESGGGPQNHNFEVTSGDLIETIYTAGSWASENEYSIKNEVNTVVAESGSGGTIPENISYNVPLEGTPDPPLLLAPTDSQVNCTNPVNLTWTVDENTYISDIFIADNPEFSQETHLEDVVSPYQVTLEAGTRYYWKVKAIGYNGLDIESSIFSFITEFDVINEFPYTEDFENQWYNSPSAPVAWQQIVVSGTNNWEQSSTNPHSGSYCAKAPYHINGGEHLLITPSFSMDENTTYRLKFWLKGHGTYPTDLKVQLGESNYNSEEDFNIDLAYYVTGNNMPTEWTEETLEISGYNGNYSIAFRAIDNDGLYVYLDDVSFQEVSDSALVLIQPEAVNFGQCSLNSSGESETITITNIGGDSASIQNIWLENSDLFTLTDSHTYPYLLESQNFITIDVSPQTNQEGIHQDILHIQEMNVGDVSSTTIHDIILDVEIIDNTGDNHENPYLLTYSSQIIENGSTTGFNQSYDFCTSPSVVYKLSLEQAKIMDISLEGTSWDTKLWVFDSYESIAIATASEDAWYYNDDEQNAGQGGRTAPMKSRDRATWSKMNPTYCSQGDYYIVISGFNNAFGDYVMTLNLDEFTIPESVTYLSPENSSSDIDNSGSLVWEDSQLADGYLVYLSSDINFTGLEGQDIQSTSYEFNNLDYSTTYYWKVIPYNSLGQTEENIDTWSFTTIDDPSLVLPISFDFEGTLNIPEGITETNMTLSGSTHGQTSNVLSKNIYSTSSNAYLQFERMINITSTSEIMFDYRIVEYESPWPATTLVSGHDYIEIQISEDEGNSFETVASINNDNHITSTDMASYSLNIGEYAGQSLILRLEMSWDNENDYYIDLDNFEFREPYPIILEAQANIGSINLTWSPPTENARLRDLLGYNVYRDNLQINSIILSNTEYDDSAISHGEIYEYYVEALYQDEVSKESNRVQVFAMEYYLEGEGTEENPYTVEDLDDLYCLSITPPYWQTGLYIEQMADIDASETQNWYEGLGFSPIGTYSDKFQANYNGNGFVITNLFINSPETSRIGLFGEVYNGSVSNVGLINVSITGDQNVGSLIGIASYTNISKCFSLGSVSGTYSVGGLMGSCVWDSSLENSYSLVSVTSTNYRSGGLVGNTSSSVISNCFSAGLVDGNTGVGGLVGESSSTITNCFWDTENSNQTTSEGGTGLPSNQMKDPLTYMNAGWDFSGESANGEEDIWAIFGYDYPHLSSEFIAPPQNLTASLAIINEIHLTWSAPEPHLVSSRAILGYNVYRNDIQINESTIETTSFNDTNVQNNQIYSYYVTAVFHEGQSIGSNTVEIDYSLLLGQGTENSPYLIQNLYDLFMLSQIVNYWSNNYHFEQTTDIDASDTQDWDDGAGFSPIGSDDIPFTGNYNGNHYSISNLYIDRVDTDNVGLFGKVYNAYLENISLIDVFIIARSRVGSLAGVSTNSDYYGCSASGQLIVSTQPVNNNSYSGGLIGRNSSSGAPSTISSCYTDVYITATANANRIGGITGFMLSGWSDVTGYPMLIENCYSHGACYGGDEIGGLVGVVQVHANGQLITIKDSYTTTDVNHDSMSGGVIGRRIGISETISCFWNDDTSGVISGVGDGDETGIEEKTTEELQTLSTFIDAGWDFQAETANGQEDYWTFVAYDYPHLAWEGYTNDLYPPALNLQASVEDGSITLTWSRPQQQVLESRAFLGYNVYRDSIQINTETVLERTYIDTDLVHDQTYNYYVRALYDEGESEASNSIDAQAINHILSGQGTQSNPYLINNITDLNVLSQKNIYWASGTYIEQTADIDASDTQNWDGGAGFSPIGTSHSNTFEGNYNGNNFVISSLYINRPSRNYVGFFGYNRNATITNVCLEDSEINGADRVGGLLGQVYESTISNSHSTGSVIGDTYVGGLVGCADRSTISNSYSSGTINGDSAVGGLVGFINYSTISNSYSSGLISGDSGVGGVAGFAVFLTISNSYSSCLISGDSYVGGLVGDSAGNGETIEGNNSFWDTQTSNQNTSVGGGTGLTTAEMQTLSTYLDAGWDFQAETDNGTDDIWTFVANDYPHLAWEGYETQLTSPPINLQATVDDGIINLSWSPPQEQALASRAFLGYNVYRDSIQINTEAILDTLYTDTDLVQAQTYTYYVRALYDEGESEASNTIDVQAVFYILAGQGTESSPYLIDNLLDLYILSQANTFWGPGTYIEQTADIDASDTQNWDDGAGFSPIGNYDVPFKGVYNGNGFIINNLYISRSNISYQGLFGEIRNSSISQIGMENVNIHGNQVVGGLVGITFYSDISKCYTTGTVNGLTTVGGLIGAVFHNTNLNNCCSYVDVHADNRFAGGLVGWLNQATITNCYSVGSVSSDSQSGGLVGEILTSTVNNSYWDTQTSNQTSSAGGTGLTTAEMQTLSTYLDAGWDFQAETDNGTDDIWTFVANDYPHLAWEGYTNELTSPPLNLQATIEDGSITLAWSPPQQQVLESRAFLGYNVYRDSIQINTEVILDTLYSDTDLVHDQSYTYYVRALYDEGESEVSNSIDAQAIYLFLSGQGTQSNPYLINNLTDLYVLSQKNMYWASGTYIEQTADIDASDTQYWDEGAGFSPIGTNNSEFKGYYNGNHYIITNLYINRPEQDYVGLFGNIRNATMNNVGIEEAEINGYESIGGLMGQAYDSTISNSYSTGLVSGHLEIGGLVGYASETTISNSYTSVSVNGNSKIGGLLGFSTRSTINNSYSAGSVSGGADVGGLVGIGIIESFISNSYSVSAVNGEFRVGGLIGYSHDDTISNSYSAGSVSGLLYVGGLIGDYEYFSVSNSFWDVQTSNQTTSAGGTGLPTSQMQTLSTYLDAGWDFADEFYNGSEDIWTFVVNDYPHLTWEDSFVNAIFEADVTLQLVNQEIHFTSTSTGLIHYYEWDFDNDGLIDSYDENPTYSYSQEGIYSVALTVSNDNQDSDTLILDDYIEIVACDIQAGLYAHYPFTSNANDESGNLLNADVYGASLTTDRFGNEDSAYAFDGVDDYIDCPDGFTDFSNGITISYWSCQEAFNSWSRIIDFGNGSRSDNIIITPAALGSNALQFQVYRGSSSSNIRLPNVIDLNNWSFWVAEIDASGYAKVYKNNVLIGQGNIGIPNNIERINNYIGRSNWASDGYYQGKIDDLRIYNRILFAQEREELYNYSESIDSPTNVTISNLGNQIVLSWEAVAGATSYKIFASELPNGEFVDVTAQGIFDGQASISNIPYSSKSNNNNGSARLRNNLSWIIDSNSGRKFYKIKAVQ